MRFTDQQRKMIETKEDRILTLASAGSGKSTTIVQRIIERVRDGDVDPHNLIFFSFSKTATSELFEKIKEAFPHTHRNFTVTTFHGFAYRELSRRGTKIEILHTGQYIKAIREFVQNFNKNNEGDEVDDKRLIELILSNNIYDLKMNEEAVFHELRGWKENNNLFTFGDILETYFDELQDPTYIKEIHERFQEVYIDEAQDTNKFQLGIMEKFIHPKVKMMVVGDILQSLYEFAGATPDALIKFTKKYNFKLMHLNKTFRFGTNIGLVADRVVDAVAVEDEYKILTIPSTHTDRVTTIIGDAKDFSNVALRIADAVSEHGENEVSYIARTNKSLDLMNLELRKLGIKVCMKGGSLLQRKEVKVLFDLAKGMNSQKSEDLNKVYNILGDGINRRVLHKVLTTAEAKGIKLVNPVQIYDFVDSFRVDGIGKTRNFGFQQVAETYKELAKVNTRSSGYWSKVAKAVKIEGMDFMFGKGDDGTPVSEKRWETIRFLDELQETYSESTNTVNEFINLLEVDFGTNQDKAEDGVKLMTIHGAKGMTLPYTFLNLHDFMSPFFVKNSQSFRAELFCLYVGITRAKYELFIILSDDHSLKFILDDEIDPPTGFKEATEGQAKTNKEAFLELDRKGHTTSSEEITTPSVKAMTVKAVMLIGNIKGKPIEAWFPFNYVKVEDGKVFVPKWMIKGNF